MKLSCKFSFLGSTYILSFDKIKKPDCWTWGITSRVTGTNLHIILLDYDNMREDFIVNELEFLQEIFRLGNFYLFRTYLEGYRDDEKTVPVGNYHAINLEEDFIKSRLDILRCTSSEYAFRNAPHYNPERHWVVRQGEKGEREKPVFVRTIESPYEKEIKNLQSTAHAVFLDMTFGTTIEKNLVNPDGNEELIVEEYVTGNRTKLKKIKTDSKADDVQTHEKDLN